MRSRGTLAQYSLPRQQQARGRAPEAADCRVIVGQDLQAHATSSDHGSTKDRVDLDR